MGTIYRRQVRFCTTCHRRLDTIAARQACEAAGHAIELREQGPYWIKYQVNGRPQCVSSESDKKEVAKSQLKVVPMAGRRPKRAPPARAGVARDGR